MPNRNTRNRSDVTSAEVMAAYLDHRNDELLDAVSTAAALVAGADGRIEPVERGQLIDFLDRSELLSVFTRAEILDAFDRGLRELREPGGLATALERFRRHAGRPLARLLVNASEEVAIADCRLHPREQNVLELMRHVLEEPSPSVEPESYRRDDTP
jgi:tellurite resistance protein